MKTDLVPWRNQLWENKLCLCYNSLLWSSSTWWIW